jgi:hypothetical protein
MAVEDLELVSRVQRVEKFGKGLAQFCWCLAGRGRYQAITTFVHNLYLESRRGKAFHIVFLANSNSN